MNIWEELKKKIKNGETVSAEDVAKEIVALQKNGYQSSQKNDNDETVKPDNGLVEKDETQKNDNNATVKHDGAIDVPSYEKLTYTPPTDEQINESAKNQLAEYKKSSLVGIDERAQAEKDKASKAKEESEIKVREKESSINRTYDESKENINNDMLRRGLARSSTAVLLGAQNENEKLNAIQKVRAEYEKELRTLDEKIEQAEKDRLKAIDDFNIEYAVKYAMKVEDLKAERYEKQREVIKFNNEVESKAYENKLDGIKLDLEIKEKQEKDESEKQENSNKDEGDKDFADKENGENKPNNDNDSQTPPKEENESNKDEQSQENDKHTDLQLYEILRNHLLSLSPQEAYNAVRNHKIYSTSLSTLSYLKLLEEFGR